MSTSGSISGINFSGLSSGIDTSSIIQKLVSLESQPLQTYQSQLSDLQNQQSVFAGLKTQLQSIASAVSALNAPLAFNPVSATSSDTTVATITGSTTAAAGIYNLTVSKLAQAQKIASAAQTDTTSALNKTGTFVVNGKVIQVSATDSLQKIAQNINSAGAGVTASLIDGGSGNAYLTIAANSSGVKNKIQIADVTGGVMGSLGVIGGAATSRETITNGVTSYNFSSSTQTLGQLLPNSGITSASFQVDGNTVNVDFSSDTLTSLAAKITAAGSPSTVRTVTDSSGNTTYKLDIVSTVGGDTFTDSQNVLQALGVLQQAPTSELVKAQDASYSLDGVPLTSSSNTITTAIPGATLTLLNADATTPKTATLSLTKDTNSIQKNIQAFADAYNSAIDYVNQNSSFDTKSYASGPLFGDPTAQQVVSGVSSLLFSNMPGAVGSYTNLASIGFGLDENGKITVDSSKLSAAIANSPDSLQSLFETVGSSSASGLNYITAGNNTKSGTYSVNITALPTYASYVAKGAQTDPTSNAENLTFSGSLFGSNIVLAIPQGTDQAGLIDLINNDSRLNTLIQAGTDGNGHLKLTSLKSGSLGNFTVSSNQGDDTGDVSGIGTGTDGTISLGADLQGTINGEAATGGPNGMLTGNSGNANTDGLQIQYQGTSTGVIGNITVNKGIAATIGDMINQFTDPISGLLAARDQAFTSEENDINDSITKLQQQVQDLTTQLQTKFANMESAIAQLQQQGAQLSQGFASWSNTSTSK
ncbi:MAG TPA: flagellar filament capping protein FliD [Fimbriimonadaceae bacterium]|nr:flagellar filament capping protein FliD [Fimbriimonadaceae bacterium]